MKSLLIQAIAVCGAMGAALPGGDAVPHKVVRRSGGIYATPHDKYSSSVGVLGCKINSNRVAYWPGSIGCDNICVKVTHEGRSVHLLRIDTSEGAHDMSYDAWNYLVTGKPAHEQPTTGGGVAMDYEEVDPSNCADIIKTDDGKLPLSAANSMNYLASCLGEPNSWVAKNYRLYNVLDPICTLGYDEPCDLDWPAANQAKCPSTLGVPNPLKSCPVYDVQYATGKSVLAGTNQVVDVNYESGSQAPSPPATKIQIPYPSTKAAAPPAPVIETPPTQSQEKTEQKPEAKPEEQPKGQDEYKEKDAPAPTPKGPETANDNYPGGVFVGSSPSDNDKSPSTESPSAPGSTANGSDNSATTPAPGAKPKTVVEAASTTIYVPFSILVPLLVAFVM